MPYTEDSAKEYFDLTVIAGDDLANAFRPLDSLSPVHEAVLQWEKTRKRPGSEADHVELTKAGNALSRLVEIDGVREHATPEQLSEIKNQIEAWQCIVVDPEVIEEM